MNERRDDTTEPDEPSGKGHQPASGHERRPGSYYYDDATGYEIYDPEKDENEDDNDEIM